MPYGIETSNSHSFYSVPLKVIYFGRIEDEQKRISDTLRGMISVLKKLPNCEFDIYGWGNSVKKVKSIIEKEGQNLPIRFKGPVDSTEAFDIISKYQVFLFVLYLEEVKQHVQVTRSF